MRRVNPKVYTKKYYLTDCSGYEQYKSSYGKKLEPRFRVIVGEIPSPRGLDVLDIGCGRGELVFWARAKGAKKVIGIDYSKDAINLANEAKKHFPNQVARKTSFLCLDAKHIAQLKLKFDLVILTEVLEHLYPEELKLIFLEIKKILNDGGSIFLHTAPNRWFNEYTYKYWCYPVSSLLVKLSNLLSGHSYGNIDKPVNIRTESHKIMHVNEPTYFSLRKLFLDCKLKGEIRSTNITVKKPELSWKDKLFNLLVYLYPFSCFFPLNIFWGNDFFVVLCKDEN